MDDAIRNVLDNLGGCQEQLDKHKAAGERRRVLLENSILSLLHKRSLLQSKLDLLQNQHPSLVPNAQNASNQGSVPEISREELRKLLVSFYKKYNQAKVDQVDAVMKHFGVRFAALNEALMIQYGVGVFATSLPSDHPGVESESKNKQNDVKQSYHELKMELSHIQELLNYAKLEYHLPSIRDYSMRIGNDSNVLVGIGQTILERVSGSALFFLGPSKPLHSSGSTQRHKGNTSSLVIKTTEPVRVAIRFEHLEVIRNANYTWVPNATGGSTPPGSQSSNNDTKNRNPFQNASTTRLEGVESKVDVKFNLSFVFRNGQWHAARDFEFCIHHMDNKVSNSILPSKMVNSLLQLAFNNLLPRIIKNAIVDLLPLEIGRVFRASQLAVDEASSIRAQVNLEMLGEFKLGELKKPISEHPNKGSHSDTINFENLKSWNAAIRGLFEASKSNSEQTKVLKMIGLTEAPTVLSLLLLQHKLEFLNRLQSTELKHCFEALLNECDKVQKNLRRRELSNEHEIDELPSSWTTVLNASKLPMRINIEIVSLELKLNTTQALDTYQAVLWKEARSQTLHTPDLLNNLLQRVHWRGSQVKRILSVVKAFSPVQSFKVTGVCSGGDSPSFEFSVNEVNCDGIVQVQLTELRTGGNFNSLWSTIRKMVGWWVFQNDGSDSLQAEGGVDVAIDDFNRNGIATHDNNWNDVVNDGVRDVAATDDDNDVATDDDGDGIEIDVARSNAAADVVTANGVVSTATTNGVVSTATTNGVVSTDAAIARNLPTSKNQRQSETHATFAVDSPKAQFSLVEKVLNKVLKHLLSMQFFAQGESYIGPNSNDLIVKLRRSSIEDPRPALLLSLQGSLIDMVDTQPSELVGNCLVPHAESVIDLKELGELACRAKIKGGLTVHHVVEQLGNNPKGLTKSLAKVLLEHAPLDFLKGTSFNQVFQDDLLAIIGVLWKANLQTDHTGEDTEVEDDTDEDDDGSSYGSEETSSC